MDPSRTSNGRRRTASLTLGPHEGGAQGAAEEEDPMTTAARPVSLSLLARLEAKPGKEAEVEALLKSAVSLAVEETKTVHWFALKMGPTTFGVFDTFADEEGRKAHLEGRIAAALMAKAPELLATAPVIERVEIIGSKT
jgi:quinol monooxygenase YgiN